MKIWLKLKVVHAFCEFSYLIQVYISEHPSMMHLGLQRELIPAVLRQKIAGAK